MTCDYTQYARPSASNHDGGKRVRLGLAPGINHPVVLASHRGALIAPHCFNDLERFFQFFYAGSSGRVLISISPIFVFLPTSADAEYEATTTHVLKGRGHLGQQGGIAKGLAQHSMAKRKLGIEGSPVGEGRPALQQMSILILEMVGEPDRVEMPGGKLQA